MNAVSQALVEHDENQPPRREIVSAPSVAMTPMDMLNHAVANGQGIDVIGKLMDLQERWEKNQGRKAFDAAMSDAKAAIPPILKNRLVDFTGKTGMRTHYQHEDLAEIARTIDPILARHGLSYRYRTQQEGGGVTVTCIVSHRDGHFEENTLSAGRDESGNKNSIQAVGSTITYLQRYTLKAALGLAASNDDDGKTADRKPEDDRTISEEQVGIVRALIEETETDIAKFCQLMKVESVPDLPASQFAKVVASLETKKRRMVK